jgi:MFS family permease
MASRLTTTATAPRLVLVLGTVLLAGLLSGYDQGVAATAQGLGIWTMPGAIVGALACGVLADRAGYRHALPAAGALFAAGSAMQVLMPGAAPLAAGRLAAGAGVGAAAVAALLSVAELAPAALRGRIAASYQLAITAGLLLAYVLSGAESAGGWQPMPAVAVALGLLLMITATTARRGGYEKGARTGRADWRRPLAVGIGLAIFQHATGIGVTATYIGQSLAADSTGPQPVATWAIGGIAAAATLLAIFCVDRLGRRPLLLTGLAGMALGLATAAVTLLAAPPYSDVPGIVATAALVACLAGFAISLGPVTWVVIAEIFPAGARGRSIALAIAASWAAGFLVDACTPYLSGALGDQATLWLFAVFCAIAWVWVYYSVPETKGKTLEQIERSWGEL